MNQKIIFDVTESSFGEEVINASDNKLIIVDFWAPWCGPCKQLTPLLEKVINKASGKVLLAKINIDENQQIAAQLRIQSIPTVFAFKNKKIVNAFQGVISESQILEFIEKALEEKLEDNFVDFFESIEGFIKNKEFSEAIKLLIEFVSKNSNNVIALSKLLECYLELDEFDKINQLLDSLEKDIKENVEILKIIKRLEIINKNKSDGPPIDELLDNLNKNPKNVDLLIEISDKYFSEKKYNEAFDILLKNYSINKEKIKLKMVEFFEALGMTHEITILYRKKLSSLMFS